MACAIYSINYYINGEMINSVTRYSENFKGEHWVSYDIDNFEDMEKFLDEAFPNDTFIPAYRKVHTISFFKKPKHNYELWIENIFGQWLFADSDFDKNHEIYNCEIVISEITPTMKSLFSNYDSDFVLKYLTEKGWVKNFIQSIIKNS